jgi:hypothetical protein
MVQQTRRFRREKWNRRGGKLPRHAAIRQITLPIISPYLAATAEQS